MTHDKSTAQYFATIIAVAGLVLLALLSVGADEWRARESSQATMLLIGGMISVASACSAWLFRNGNGSYADGPAVPQKGEKGDTAAP